MNHLTHKNGAVGLAVGLPCPAVDLQGTGLAALSRSPELSGDFFDTLPQRQARAGRVPWRAAGSLGPWGRAPKRWDFVGIWHGNQPEKRAGDRWDDGWKSGSVSMVEKNSIARFIEG